LSITLLVSLTLSAQASAELKWELGAKGGANWAKLTGDQIGLWLTGDDGQLAGTIGDSKLGFNGGIFATAFITGFFGVQVEAMYIQKGGEGVSKGLLVYQQPGDIPRTVEFDGTIYAYFDYLEFPVLAVFNFDATDDSKVRLRGFFGPVFAYNVQSKAKLEGTLYAQPGDTSFRTQSIDEEREVDEYVKSFEFGLMFGGAAYWDIGSVDLIFEGRWEMGMTTLDNTTLARDVKTSNVSILLGVAYPFGG
jgi:hypothetical protein